MSRASNGTYTRVNNSFSNPVPGTTIDATDADGLFDDIETEMTDSLCRSGKGSMLANLSMGGFAITTASQVQFKGSSSGFTVLAPSAAASGTLTLPATTDTLVGKATTDTLTNKTIDTAGTNTIKVNGNTLAASSGTATLTLPNSTDTIVGRATTDTLTSKTISGSSNTLSNIAVSSMAAQAAYTFVGNNSGSSAVPTAVDIAALTTKASPAAGDYVMISDQAASGAWKKATVSSVSSAGSVSSWNGQTGAIVAYFPPQGRITLTTAVPVVTSTVSGATTVYYTPYVGNMVPIYDGTNMVPTAVAEVSQATTDNTKSPAAVAASKVYDLFVWNDSGTIRCTRGPAWTNSTTRGYTFTMVNGILLNTSAITNGPGASRGTWVGTIASNGSSTIDYIFGAAASGGTAAVLNVWNVYNRVLTPTTVTDSGTTYTYATNTVRQARASAGNQISFVTGAQEDSVHVNYNAGVTTAAGGACACGVGLNSTTTFGFTPFGVQCATALSFSGTASGEWFAPIGTNTVSANEVSLTGTNTFNDNSYGNRNTLSAIIRN